ncbi:MAG: Dabb family protein [Acidobacteria bacterium]|nr:Dabb family protein [Acidobacteriota bacterium]
MIRHLVLFRLRSESPQERAEHLAGMRSRLEGLRSVVPGTLSIHVGPDVGGGPNHWDVALVSEFEDQGALDAYQAHPDHLAAIAYLADFVTERSIADVEVSGDAPHDAWEPFPPPARSV